MLKSFYAAFGLASALLASLAAAATQPAAPAQPPPKISLVVADKHCATIVQPFDIKDNTATLIGSSVKRGAGAAMKFIERKLGGDKNKAADQADKNALTEDTRNEAKQLNWLPMSAEVKYGERAHEQMLPDLLDRESKQGKKLYPQADEVLKQVLAPVDGKHEYTFQLYILKASTRNAMARPGGFLYVDQGLLSDPKMKLKARFALAHEVAHVLQRHETKELQGMIVDSFTAKDEMQTAILNAKKDPDALLRNVKVGKDIYVRHQIDQELQADSCSARLLSEAFPERHELANTITAFLKDLPPYDPQQATAVPTSTHAGVAPAGTSSSEKSAQIIAAAGTLGQIVKSPESRHPNTLERTQNLDEIFQELSATKLETAGVAGPEAPR
jgi:predicted Zn-dependent protease